VSRVGPSTRGFFVDDSVPLASAKESKDLFEVFWAIAAIVMEFGVLRGDALREMRARRVDAIADARYYRSHDVDRVYVSKRMIKGLAPILLGRLSRRFNEFAKSFFCCLVCCPTSSKTL